MAKKITFAYIVVGCIWILTGDYLLGFFVRHETLTKEQVFYLSISKGIGYVLLTGLALFFYLRRSFNNLSNLEKKYRALFEENPNPMWVYDPENLKFLAINNAALQTYGYTQEEMLLLTLRDIRPAEEVPILEKQIVQIKNEIINSGVYKHKRKNGEVFFVNIYSGPTKFGKINARLILALDVSEKEIAEEQIIKLNKDLSAFKLRLINILSTVNDVVWSCDANTFNINYISDACIKTFGYKPEEFYKNNNLWATMKHPEYRQQDYENRTHLLENGRSEIEYKITTGTGETRVIYNKSIVQYDNNKPTEILGIATDITLLRESEQKLKSYSERIANILDGITDGFITIDKEWRFTFVNKVFLRITDKNIHDLLGVPIWDVFPQLKDSLFHTHLTLAEAEQTRLHFEEQYFDDRHWYSTTIYPNVDGLAIYFTDVTLTYEMRQEMVRTKNNLKTLINNTDDLIWSVSTDHKLISTNNAYKKFINLLLGWAPNEGDNAIFAMLPQNKSSRWENFYNTVFEGKPLFIEEKFTLPEVGDMYFEVNFNPIFNSEGLITGAACFAREITQRKIYELQMEEQNKKLIEISWLHSHAVRAPLSSIMGLVNLFNAQNPADPQNIEVLNLMDIATKKLDSIVSEIVVKSDEVRLQNSTKLNKPVVASN